MTSEQAALTSTEEAIVSAQDALILLRTGRTHMAQWHFSKLPERIYGAIEGARAEGWQRGHETGKEAACAEARREGYAEGVRAASAPPRSVADRGRLARLCALPEGRALARAVLKIEDRDLDAVLAGRVRLAPSAWQRLWSVVA